MCHNMPIIDCNQSGWLKLLTLIILLSTLVYITQLILSDVIVYCLSATVTCNKIIVSAKMTVLSSFEELNIPTSYWCETGDEDCVLLTTKIWRR